MYRRHGDVILLESVAYHLTVCMVKWYATLSNTERLMEIVQFLKKKLITHCSVFLANYLVDHQIFEGQKM